MIKTFKTIQVFKSFTFFKFHLKEYVLVLQNQSNVQQKLEKFFLQTFYYSINKIDTIFIINCH